MRVKEEILADVERTLKHLKKNAHLLESLPERLLAPKKKKLSEHEVEAVLEKVMGRKVGDLNKNHRKRFNEIHKQFAKKKMASKKGWLSFLNKKKKKVKVRANKKRAA